MRRLMSFSWDSFFIANANQAVTQKLYHVYANGLVSERYI